jgi:hypothetical protein
MAKVADIINQMQAVLPRYSDKFHKELGITSIDVSGGIATVTTQSSHGLISGNIVTIQGVRINNPITVTSIESDGILATCTNEHDLTLNFGPNPTNEIDISGFSNYPSPQTLIDVNSPNAFTFAGDDAPIGSGILLEDRLDDINGRKTITVTGNNTFTYPTTTASTSFELTNALMIYKIRVSGAVTAEAVVAYYTAQKKPTDYWAFVVNGDLSISHDRNVSSDANTRLSSNEGLFIEAIQPFNVYVFIPSTEQISGRLAQDEIFEIRKAFYKTLAGVQFDSGLASEEKRFLATPFSDGFFAYAGAYYVHEFIFETVFKIYYEDVVDPDDSTAFRRYEGDIKLEFDEYDLVKKELRVDLP